MVFVTPYYTGFTEWKPLLYLKSAYFTTSAGMRGILSAMAHGGKWHRMRISWISAGTDKAPRRNETAQPHIITRKRTICQLSHGASRASRENGESPEKSPRLVVLEELDGLVLLEKLATLEMLEEY